MYINKTIAERNWKGLKSQIGIENMTRLTIAISVYNRRKTFERMLSSLLRSKMDFDDLTINIRIYDDCSDEFTENEIKDAFPYKIDYYRHDKNRGADYNMGFVYRDFLDKGDDILFNADSDLIYDENWLSAVLDYLPQTDGVLSLFNTPAHPFGRMEGELGIKDTVGNAGTAMTRSTVEMICNNIKETESYNSLDWNWCGLLQSKGKKIYCTTRSYVQHIGIDGFNSGKGVMDIGENFDVNSLTNGRILGDVLFEYVSDMNTSRSEKRTFYYLFPYDKVPYGSRVVIYGAGVVGRDYLKQIELCDYCKEIVCVDKNYDKHVNVCNPDILKTIDCDFVVIAANLLHIRNEMKRDILELNPLLDEKLVDISPRIFRYY